MTDAASQTLEELARLAAVNMPRAVKLAGVTKARGARHPMVHHLVALGLKDQGQFDAAITELGLGLELDPNDPRLMTEVGFCLLELGRRQEAARVLGVAIKLAPDSPDTNFAYAWAAQRLGALDAAQSALERAVALNPRHADALAGLSGLAARRREWDAARSYAERAVAVDPKQTDALMNLARVDMGVGRNDAAARRLRDVVRLPFLKPEARGNAWLMLGDALDGDGRYRDAFDAYTEGKADLRRQFAHVYEAPGMSSVTEGAREILTEFREAPPGAWSAPADPMPAGPARGHAFLVGFPRSGTTLLEQVLATHPDIVSLEERPTLIDAEEQFLTEPGGVRRLAEIPSEALEPFRQAYWRRVRDFAIDPTDKLFVDKHPLSTMRLPLIAKVFPEAKIIFAIRDPRDVVLSCFRRSFGMNAAMFEFHSIERAAALYDSIMTAGEAYLAELPVDAHKIRYEDLVADFDAEARRLCEFLGVPWTEGLRDFAATASARRIATPSSAQVSRGLYGEGVGQWRNYGFALEAAMPTLTPWIEKFGYAETAAEEPSAPVTPAAAATSDALSPVVEAVRAGDMPRATRGAIKALAAGHEHPLLLNLRSFDHEAHGRYAEALTDLDRALVLAPDDVSIHNARGLCLVRLGRHDEALQSYERALALKPDFAGAWFNAGAAHERLGETARAAEAYAKAAESEPRHVQAWANLAWLASRRGDAAGTRQHAERALALAPDNATALLSLAAAELTDAPAKAEMRLRGLIARPDFADYDRAIALGQLGDALDAQDKPAEAFAAYAESNAMFAAEAAPRFAGQSTVADTLKWLVPWAQKLKAGAWTATPTGADPGAGQSGHVFLIGFPRSGTTLIESLLAAHPDVVSLEERGTLDSAVTAFMGDADSLSRLATLNAADLAHYREDYWARVARFGADVRGKIFIDKNPFNTLKLPVIYKLFPHAKVIFARRDPRDVVLSCFRRRFNLNPSTFELLDLARAAAFYDGAMRLWRALEAKQPLASHTLVYERLVQDFTAEAQAVVAFIGADWRPELANFAERGRRGEVASASAAQIARGLYDGAGQWRRYRAELAPVLPKLAPWVKAFDYPAD